MVEKRIPVHFNRSVRRTENEHEECKQREEIGGHYKNKVLLILDLFLKHFPEPAEATINDSGLVHDAEDIPIERALCLLKNVRENALKQLDGVQYGLAARDLLRELIILTDLEPSPSFLDLMNRDQPATDLKKEFDELLGDLLSPLL